MKDFLEELAKWSSSVGSFGRLDNNGNDEVKVLFNIGPEREERIEDLDLSSHFLFKVSLENFKKVGQDCW